MTTENEYLEMSNHFKQVLDKKDAYINYLQSSLSHVTSDLESINNSITATKMILRMWCCMNSATSETMEKEMNKIQENIKDKMVDITHLDTSFEEFEETYDIAESLHEIQV